MSQEEIWDWDDMMMEVEEISIADELKGTNELTASKKSIKVIDATLFFNENHHYFVS